MRQIVKAILSHDKAHVHSYCLVIQAGFYQISSKSSAHPIFAYPEDFSAAKLGRAF